MTQYNTLNVKLSNSQLYKFKSSIKNGNTVNLNLSSNIIGGSNYENSFPDKLLLTNTQVSRPCKGFANNSSANIKLSKTQLLKIGQSKGFLDKTSSKQSIEDSGLLIKDVGEIIKNKAKEQTGGFLGMLLYALGSSLLGNLLVGKGTIRPGEKTIRAGENF